MLRFTKTPYTSEVELEKHPSYMLGVVDFTPEIKTLTDFTDTSSGNTGFVLNVRKITKKKSVLFSFIAGELTI